jgi:hypothetical protein
MKQLATPMILTRLVGKTDKVNIDQFVQLDTLISDMDNELRQAKKGNKMKNKALFDDGTDDLEKGELYSDFQYGNGSNIKFDKNGKEVKKVLNKLIPKLEGIQSAAATKMAALKATIDDEPTEKCYYGSYQTVSKFFDVPNMYAWDTCYSKGSSDGLISNGDSNQPSDDQKNRVKYNEQFRIWMDVSEDIATAKLLISNLEDAKKYSLTIKQLFMMGALD